MELSNEQLEEIEKFAGLFFGLDDIAIITGIDIDLFIQEYENQHSAIYLAVKKGQLLTEAALRQKTIELAKDGHAPSVGVANDYINTFKMRNV